MKKYIWILIAVSLGGCVTADQPPPSVAAQASTSEIHTPIKLTKAEISAIQAGTRSALKDPDSAKFGNIVAGTDSRGSVIACLMVNAKNSYGGYTGEKPYFGMLFREKPPAKFVVVPGDNKLPEFRDEAVLTVCRNYGLSPV